MTQPSLQQLEQHDAFIQRHIGPDDAQTREMLNTLGVSSLDELIEKTVPAAIRKTDELNLSDAVDEAEALAELKALASRNKIYRTFIGMGYHDTITPNVILRNVLENPGWYTAYTPYQPEIAQGRLEGLLNFQQMIMDLTGMEMANASMLDEGTAAAEAMAMCKRQVKRNKSNVFFVDADCHPQTIAVVKTRAEHFGFEVIVGDVEKDIPAELFGALLQYPGSTGRVRDLTDIIAGVHEAGALVTVAADLMSLVALKAPGEMGADVVVGSNQRFGIPMGYGGPHAAFFAFREAYKRSAPGRIIGVSVDSKGKRALRMAMQTREQHIRREKANSNICTSQVLLAVMSAFYAIYHGPEGLKTIAARIQRLTDILAAGLKAKGFALAHDSWFDTLTVNTGDKQGEIYQRALDAEINLRKVAGDALGVSLHETATLQDVSDILDAFCGAAHGLDLSALDSEIAAKGSQGLPAELARKSEFLTHPVFNSYHSETEMLRYLKTLESKDIALNHSMIPLGSCTMKLNATAEMIPVTWPEFGKLHPFVPADQAQGYAALFEQLQQMLAACTGYDAVSLQPNAGSQGEYAGLVAIKKYFEAKGETQRDICLIPASAHGTNPASAMMAGMKVVVVACDSKGNVDIDNLKAKVEEHGERIAALMVTYPSTHGVFEEGIREICDLIHAAGGQVYIDGANMNALIGVAAPGQFGGDVSHLNLHKTFCIPHGGGGPGMGPIAVGEHLKPYLAGHPVTEIPGTDTANGTISAAPWGSASILPISWMYIRMMGKQGMKRATEMAILNANYVAKRLSEHYTLLYTGSNGFVAHECLVDLRPLKEASGISEEDIAKRLMDFGFHAPTMSFPVAGTLMIEPTESESKEELDRFIEAMTIIRKEVEQVINGEYSAGDNPLHNAPHTLDDVMADQWQHSYSRDVAGRPASWLKSHKVWPASNRIDNVYGDRNLICSCPPVESYAE
ncbi:aminomethyl-transferring glycine dehydrogenase [Microbulbifer thermotolerans]|uniref:aminomethyl-transferring glycine dehydrogenase n=1 Tax=Microbulbifer thermotolerans TaxID=252514 RepID=UPI0022499313|nr:aminomethyl-transferring glycine dehydrogenase [Microbulbifer thermotolerans]MCX2781152.1 aminomethyl-transferring glycine dehydrogenase [Microbulbifer thermotolerans]MCX2804613.1 aminomethyl-transferring glycine dehydrogenase [Microbulbifer thermotolerans]MCX2831508.1 aminomethyl-transferring glycine dehydrogenase [Microbulbifer thermotolerans]MCX2842907.1 aminomethyl-transferring glycine dehydrogenase [Microbulbifer thermotolerans]